MTAPPEYLPRPAGYEARVAALVAAGTQEAEAHWMAACEAIGAVGRRETNDRDLFWHDDAAADLRDTWERIADREGRRFYFHQRKDTLVGFLAHRRHEDRTNTRLAHDRNERLVTFIKERGLWPDWLDYVKARREAKKGAGQ
ncbi:hypothetical protein [Streptomyces sp. NPDC056683]|uniref:hypothetical protein n=1 Tax=Streptomyces sp. NPDC056683 TaxID=3345910 RepID=UPI0036A93E64